MWRSRHPFSAKLNAPKPHPLENIALTRQVDVIAQLNEVFKLNEVRVERKLTVHVADDLHQIGEKLLGLSGERRGAKREAANSKGEGHQTRGGMEQCQTQGRTEGNVYPSKDGNVLSHQARVTHTP